MNNLLKVKHLWAVCLLTASLFLAPASVRASEGGSSVDVKEIVLGHLGDAYEWHITTWKGHHVSIPLPVIVRSENGEWTCFSSARFHESKDGMYQGFYLNNEANGKKSMRCRPMESVCVP